MLNLRIFVATCSLFCGSTAHADWQYTKWGMTPEQVQAASPDVADASKSDSGRATHAFPLHAPYTAAGLVFDARFGFDRKTNKLSKVLLQVKDKEKCEDVASMMSAKYGTPVDASTETAKTWVWKDQASGNRIEFVTIDLGPMCMLMYYPIAADAANGL